MMRLFSCKILLNFCNLLFLFCGIILVTSGFYLFNDQKRILLSRLVAATSEQLNNLPQPLFFYISIGLTVAGLLVVIAALVGFWASFLNTYYCLSFYFLAVVVLFLTESTICLSIILWPHCLGITLDESKMVKILQGYYGVNGKVQFTNAMDLAQARFGCCGMNSDINYDTSLWKLQRYGQREWVVPLTCCILTNTDDILSYLDPKPVNETQCQMLHKTQFSEYRHIMPCLKYLDKWYHEQYLVFLSACLILAIVQFCVLLSIIVNCSKISSKKVEVKKMSEPRKTPTRTHRSLVENIYEQDVALRTLRASFGENIGNVYTEDTREVYVQPGNLNKHLRNTTFKPIVSDYNSTKHGYLVK